MEHRGCGYCRCCSWEFRLVMIIVSVKNCIIAMAHGRYLGIWTLGWEKGIALNSEAYFVCRHLPNQLNDYKSSLQPLLTVIRLLLVGKIMRAYAASSIDKIMRFSGDRYVESEQKVDFSHFSFSSCYDLHIKEYTQDTLLNTIPNTLPLHFQFCQSSSSSR
jgi:hypothetical protein